MNTFLLTGGRNFKTFLKENYAIALQLRFLRTVFSKKRTVFSKTMLDMELNMMLIVLMKFAYVVGIPKLHSRFNDYLAI